MKTSTKNALITGTCSIIVAIISGGIGYSSGINKQSVEIENIIENSGLITINQEEPLGDVVDKLLDNYISINDEVVSLSKKNTDLATRNDKLNKENKDLKKKINEKESAVSKIEELDKPEIDNQKSICLNKLPVFNCQYYKGEAWNSTEIYEWNSYEDKTADGEKHDNAVYMAISGDTNGLAKTYVVDYLLNYKYKSFNGNFMLGEENKSTTSIATLKIYGDDTVLYECHNITGGMVPQNTGDISVENVNKLRFEFTSDSGELGNHIYNFGVVFYDSILK